MKAEVSLGTVGTHIVKKDHDTPVRVARVIKCAVLYNCFARLTALQVALAIRIEDRTLVSE